jgi:hypothetical protein
VHSAICSSRYDAKIENLFGNFEIANFVRITDNQTNPTLAFSFLALLAELLSLFWDDDDM